MADTPSDMQIKRKNQTDRHTDRQTDRQRLKFK